MLGRFLILGGDAGGSAVSVDPFLYVAQHSTDNYSTPFRSYVDADGNTYVALVSATTTYQIAKIDNTGTIVWIKNISAFTNSSSLESSYGRIIGADGANILITVPYYDATTTKTVNAVAKVAFTNGAVSAATYGTPTSSYHFYGQTYWNGNGGVDSSGNVYTINQISGGNQEYSVNKFNSSLTYQYSQVTTGTAAKILGVATDDSDNMYMAGYITSNDPLRAAIAKFNSSGTRVWAKQLSSASDLAATYYENIRRITYDPVDDALYVAIGYYPGAGPYMAIVKVSPSDGSVVWARRYTADYADGICTDADGNVYFSLSISGGYSSYITKLDSDGTTLAYLKVGYSGFQTSSSKAFGLLSDGLLYLTVQNQTATPDPAMVMGIPTSLSVSGTYDALVSGDTVNFSATALTPSSPTWYSGTTTLVTDNFGTSSPSTSYLTTGSTTASTTTAVSPTSTSYTALT